MFTLNDKLDQFLGKNNWTSYCIHLKNANQRTISFTNWTNEIGLHFNWWDAFDKSNLNENDPFVIINNKIKSPGATACRISHEKLYRYLLDNYPDREYFLIFEDDAGFNKDDIKQTKNNIFVFLDYVKQFKNRWDVLWFGYHDTGMKNLQPINNNLLHVRQAHRAHAFLINRIGLEYILYYCSLNELKHLPIDWIIDYIRNSAITIGPPFTIIDQIDQISYINDDPNNKIIN